MNVDAKNYLSTAPSWGLVAYKNSGTTPPQMGDIICSNGNGVNKGHVAIVRQVLGDSIHVIHQNWANSIGLASENYYNKDANYYPLKMTLSGEKYTVSALGSGYPVTGWLHKP